MDAGWPSEVHEAGKRTWTTTDVHRQSPDHEHSYDLYNNTHRNTKEDSLYGPEIHCLPGFS